MPRLILAFVGLVAIALAGACASPAPTPTATPIPPTATPTVTPTPTLTPTPTPEPTPTPTSTPTPTPIPPPSEIEALRARAVSISAISISWDEPASGAAIMGYDYRYRAESQPWVEVLDTGLTESEVVIRGLSPDTAYYAQARAVSSTGVGEWSESARARTLALPTPTPTPRPTATPTPTPMPTATPTSTPTPSYPDTHVVLAESGLAFVSHFTSPNWQTGTSRDGSTNFYGDFDGGYYAVFTESPLTNLWIFMETSSRYSRRSHENALTDALVALGYTERQGRAIAMPHIAAAHASSRERSYCNTPSELYLYTYNRDDGWVTIVRAIGDSGWTQSEPCEEQ